MDNVNSQPQIRVPNVPTNAEALAGSTKTQLIQYIMDLISKSVISGVTPGVADVASLQTRVTLLEQELGAAQQTITEHETRIFALENP